MPQANIQQLSEALKGAHRAGDIAGAKKIAEAMSQAKFGPPRDLPEFGSIPDVGTQAQQAKLGMAFFTTPDEKARADTITKAIPGTHSPQNT